jgi:hypothetical protein
LNICEEVCDKKEKECDTFGLMIKHKEAGFFSINGWSFKKTFIPNSITNFNKLVECKKDEYKFAGLCYPLKDRKECSGIGY